ncbi:hypothetical protein [uncultured Winogradskyella sp.]|uniref:hypothetical protein n=1 Tax=uncultured Winogradskyella sp. TaxID=395353 RepID=UPI0026153EDE|nr:hypothetical protein [uncultured Winogradskyella sp.]
MQNVEKLLEIVQVSCINKDFVEYDYQEFITYKFIIHNKSTKTIRAVKGSITFNNIFDEEIQTLKFVYDQSIKPEKQAKYDATTEYNQYIEEDKSLRDKSLKDLKIVWRPEKIIFEDGSTIE